MEHTENDHSKRVCFKLRYCEYTTRFDKTVELLVHDFMSNICFLMLFCGHVFCYTDSFKNILFFRSYFSEPSDAER